MQVELIIRADSMSEIAHLFVAPSGGRPELPAFEQRVSEPDTQDRETTVAEARAKEVEPEVEAPKPTRRSRAPKQEATPSTGAQEGDTSSQEASPATSVTLDDIRTKASQLMDSGKASGADIQKMLVDKFDARAFGALKPEQYPDVIGELNNLG